MQMFQLQMMQEAKERREDRRDKAEDRAAMMQLVTSVVAGIGTCVASYMGNKSPPVPVRTKKRQHRRLVAFDSESESEAESDSDGDENVTKTTRCSRVFRDSNDVGNVKIGYKRPAD